MLKAGEVFEIAMLAHGTLHLFKSTADCRGASLAQCEPPRKLRHHRTLTTPTASSDSSSTFDTSCTEVVGCVRHCATFSVTDRRAS